MLFKKSSTWKIRQWEVIVEWDTVIKRSWLVWWKLVEVRSKSTPKNRWRSNETTAEEQANLEAISKRKKKLDEGYQTTIEKAENIITVLPMLWKSYEKVKVDWDDEIFLSPKLDWMRWLAIVKNGVCRLISRKWKDIDTLPHINFSMNAFPDGIYDWEIYCNGKTFNENMQLIKKNRPESIEVKFHMYDIITDDPFHKRTEVLKSCIEQYWDHNTIYVDQIRIEDESEITDLYGSYIDDWFEGVMIRMSSYPYEKDKRSKSLLKYKKFIDGRFKIVDIEPSDKRPTHWIVCCLADNWEIFKATPKMSHEEREELLTNKEDYIWQDWEIRYFQESEYWIPRFWVFMWVRND